MSKNNRKKKKKKNNKKIMKKSNLIIIAIVIVVIVIIGLLIFNKSKIPTLFNSNDNQELNIKKNQQELQIVDLNSNSRNIAVMINNHPTARKYHTGLQDAYIVYEIIVEGGITRFLAIYRDANTEMVGSVRSARHYYLDYVMENDAIFVHHGKSPQAQADMNTYGINHIDADKAAFWREKGLGISTEHTSYTSIPKLLEVATNKKFRTTSDQDLLLNYSVDSVDLSSKEGAIVANNINIVYSNSFKSQYAYDAENKVYLRSVTGKPHVDYKTKQQYTVKNIITYQVANSTISGDAKGRQEIKNIGTGEGWYISEGYAVPITWEKKSRQEQTVYRYKNGEEIEVNDGNTFIQIQPKNKTLEIN